MDLKRFLALEKRKIVFPSVLFAYFILAVLIKLVSGDSPGMLLYLFLPALFLSIPFWPLLKPLGLWSSTAVWDSSGPTSGGLILVAATYSVLAYVLSCTVVYFSFKKH